MPETIGKYKIVRLLGRGGAGTVYEAVNPQIGRRVAIKALKSIYSPDSQVAKRFLQEAFAANQVTHPGIVNIFDYDKTQDDITFFVMDFLDGITLARFMKKEKPCTLLRTIEIISQIAEAMAAAHEKGVIHRDLKPENIMLVGSHELPSDLRAIVLDLGIAKLTSEYQRTDTAGLTTAQTTLGTPEYMAPEQCIDSSRVDEKTDVYALGVIMYAMLAGQVPFEGDSFYVKSMHVKIPPKPIRQLATQVPDRLASLLHSMLDKEPLNRPKMVQAATELQSLRVTLEDGRSSAPIESGVPAAVPTSPPARSSEAAAVNSTSLKNEEKNVLDFSKLLDEDAEQKPVEPKSLFLSLVRAAPFEYLRDVQREILDAWHAQRPQRDVVVKMNTGAGKTLVGLLMLQSYMNEDPGPALYLCPTIQLVEQVVQQAANYGISTCQFAIDNNEIPAEFMNGEAILVTTFQKLFNGRSVFGISGGSRQPIKLNYVLVDDAHSCLAIAKDAVSITLPKTTVAYKRLLDLFKMSLEHQALGTATSIQCGDPGAFMAVPYWAWLDGLPSVTRILNDARESDELRFAWNLIRDDLAMCSCVISGSQIRITPHIVPIEKIPSFDKAKKRIFLSATLIDDSILIREFGVNEAAVTDSLKPKIKGDIGERMILAPTLIDKILGKDNVRELVTRVAQSGYNVVILVPSNKAATYWNANGVEIAEGGSIKGILERLHNSKGNIVVLVNRYDGIDLPGDDCRLLILDGLPTGGSLYERYQTAARPGSQQLASNQAQKVEQGLGRGVRSGSDYCAVVLVDDNLVSFLRLKENQQLLSAETRRQIEIGQALASQLQKAPGTATDKLFSLINQCLSQDPAWKKYHRQKLANLPEIAARPLPRQLARMERDSLKLYRAGQAMEAAERVENSLNTVQGELGDADRGWYTQYAASLCHSSDPARAQEKQRNAHDLNSFLFRPLEGIKYRKILEKTSIQAARVHAWIKQYVDSNAIPTAVNAILDKLNIEAGHQDFEQALVRLAQFLGFDAQCPKAEFGQGPDVLWAMSDGSFLLMEVAINFSPEREEITKEEVGELLNSINWFKQEYPEKKLTPILLHPFSTLAKDAFPPADTLILTPDDLSRLAAPVRNFSSALTSKAPEAWTVTEVSDLITSHDLAPRDVRSRFGGKQVKKS